MVLVDAVRAVGSALSGTSRRLAPPPASLLDAASGFWRTHALGAVARLGVADQLTDGPRDVAALAAATDADEDSLFRVLRALAADGIFRRTGPRTFALNTLAEPLRSDHPRSVRHTLIQISSGWNQRIWSDLTATVTEGSPAFPRQYGGFLWDYFAEHPDEGEHFHRSMRELSRLDMPQILAAHDFGRYERIADVGGGSGQLLAGILSAHPHLCGVLYDLPAATADAPTVLGAAGIADRVEVVNGSFYDHVPPGCDAYLMRNIVHGLTDEQARPVLARLRPAFGPRTRLLVLDCLVPEGSGGSHPGFLDLQMMVGSGGRERSAAEMAALFAANGFQLVDVRRTPGPTAIFVGRLADPSR
ncbi:methyltransferase [Micromonospora echinospora]|uniref:methyltransferase n=1 Tax=Micromonospora echinospora TaxID=1877 RepID=UPI0033E8EC16